MSLAKDTGACDILADAAIALQLLVFTYASDLSEALSGVRGEAELDQIRCTKQGRQMTTHTRIAAAELCPLLLAMRAARTAGL